MAEKDIVIVGGGIIGCTSAYFLTRHPSYDPSKHRITLLEASSIAGGASGKAGGLLALWAYPSQLVPLSYRLHAELAAEHDGENLWGYRRIHCGQLDAKGRSPPCTTGTNQHNNEDSNGDKAHVSLKKRDKEALGKLQAAGLPADLDWVAPDAAKSYNSMGDPNTTAQVHPFHFTTAMANMAKEAGVDIVEHARVISINRTASPDPAVESVSWTDKDGASQTSTASNVVLAAGPWTSRLLPSAPIAGLRAHSVTIQADVTPYALFTEIDLPAGFGRTQGSKEPSVRQSVAPEIYARPFGEIYACGEGDTLVTLPETTADVVTDIARCDDIVAQVGSISDELRNGSVLARQACYLPVARGGGNGGPWIGEVSECKGLVLASGHSCWGIQNGPGTGKCVSEIIMDGVVKSAKLGMLDPKKSL